MRALSAPDARGGGIAMAARKLIGALLVGIALGCTKPEAHGAPSKSSAGETMPTRAGLPIEGELPALVATEWINSIPLTLEDLRGKVVLVEFWTYTCINWRRQLPYVRAWADKYRANGLIVIGVHTPEFDFEKDIENVRQATQDIAIGFPIAVDSDRAIWAAFENAYWPALYFVDAQGRIRHHQFGEGEYERSEAVLQDLLREAGAANVGHAPSTVAAS